MRKSVMALLMLAAFGASARAEPIPMPDALKNFLMQPDQQQAIASMMSAEWHEVLPDCATPTLKSVNVAITTLPLAYDKNGAPTSGQWRVFGRMEGCDQHRIFNILYLFGADGKKSRVALLPGTTHADPLLQHDGLFYARSGMVKLMPHECNDLKFTDTHFVGYEGDAARAKRPWVEEWTVRACDVTGVVTMHFVPDATGTTIQVSTDETKPVSSSASIKSVQ